MVCCWTDFFAVVDVKMYGTILFFFFVYLCDYCVFLLLLELSFNWFGHLLFMQLPQRYKGLKGSTT